MMRLTAKRKAPPSSNDLEESTKKLRIDKEHDLENDDSASDYSDGDDANDMSSDKDTSRTADTPITPFSPSRSVYPSQRKTIQCTYEGCDKKFNRPARLEAHLRSHTNERPFVCSYDGCDKAYTESKHLTQHIKGSHTKERPYKCSWDGCDKAFMTGTRLRRHQEAHQGHERFRCSGYPPCKLSFRKHQTLERHIRSDHLQQYAFPCTRVDPVTKLECQAGFDTGGSLRKHEDRVHGALRYFCEECMVPGQTPESPLQPMGFRTKPDLNKHTKTTHMNCLFCELSFPSQQALQQHAELTHAEAVISTAKSKILPVCDYPGCGKEFSKKYNLDHHVRTVHKGERFYCGSSDLSESSHCPNWDGHNACGKNFVTKVNLEDHVRTQHMGLPSFVNAKRIKGASQTKKKPKADEDVEIDPVGLLTGTAYSQEEGRNIPCSVAGCDWLFTREYDLEQHIFHRHSDQDFEEHSAATSNAAFGSAYQTASNSPMPEFDFPNIDYEWSMQQQGMVNSPFWAGGDDGNMSIGVDGGDMWTMDEAEMQRLIHGNHTPDMFNMSVDPALSGL